MIYLTLAADYGPLSLRDERVGAIDLVDLDVSRELIDDLVAWNEKYQPIIQMDMDERLAAPTAALIDDLDHLGLALAKRLADAVAGEAKVQYYSEGRLQRLP